MTGQESHRTSLDQDSDYYELGIGIGWYRYYRPSRIFGTIPPPETPNTSAPINEVSG